MLLTPIQFKPIQKITEEGKENSQTHSMRPKFKLMSKLDKDTTHTKKLQANITDEHR